MPCECGNRMSGSQDSPVPGIRRQVDTGSSIAGSMAWEAHARSMHVSESYALPSPSPLISGTWPARHGMQWYLTPKQQLTQHDGTVVGVEILTAVSRLPRQVATQQQLHLQRAMCFGGTGWSGVAGFAGWQEQHCTGASIPGQADESKQTRASRRDQSDETNQTRASRREQADGSKQTGASRREQADESKQTRASRREQADESKQTRASRREQADESKQTRAGRRDQADGSSQCMAAPLWAGVGTPCRSCLLSPCQRGRPAFGQSTVSAARRRRAASTAPCPRPRGNPRTLHKHGPVLMKDHLARVEACTGQRGRSIK